ncbi:MAG TPA: class II aldolase/adducin family protein [Gammaproteobacteria bacterium]|nr:class II aldolase/adducin family protein [Gammaproteobacteria bacterium]
MQQPATPSAEARDVTARDRHLLAACVRLLHMEGLVSYNGHVSLRVPGAEAFLIHSLVDSRAEIAPGQLLVVGFDGVVLEGSAELKPPSEYPIHAEIYRARADVGAVAHIHSESAIAFTLVEDVRLMAMRCDALDWASGVPIHADPTRIKSAAQGRALAASLGNGDAVLMRAHGAVLTARSVIEVFKTCIQFEENARAQVLASRLGKPVPLTAAELDALRASHPPEFRAHYARKIWHYYVKKGERAGLIPERWLEVLL